MKVFKYAAIIIAAAVAMTACKPTEKNYRNAYEAAKSKREQKDPDEALLTGGHRLLSEAASNWRVVGGDSLQLQHILLTPTEGYSWNGTGPYRLAVAQFSMSTNAEAAIKDIKRGKLNPVVAKTGKGNLFIIAGSATTPDSLATTLQTFRSENPEFQFIGLEGEKPLIIVGR